MKLKQWNQNTSFLAANRSEMPQAGPYFLSSFFGSRQLEFVGVHANLSVRRD